MNPRTDTTFDPMAEASPDPFSEPRTIPGGWDVSAQPPRAGRGQLAARLRRNRRRLISRSGFRALFGVIPFLFRLTTETRRVCFTA